MVSYKESWQVNNEATTEELSNLALELENKTKIENQKLSQNSNLNENTKETVKLLQTLIK